jgi:hypothetical protein
MFFKKAIQNKVYRMYLNGYEINMIAFYLDLSEKDVDEIIDFMNLIHN